MNLTGIFSMLLILISCSINSIANSDTITDYIYDNQIKTVKIYRKGFNLSFPAIELGNREYMEVVFDDLDSVQTDYIYTFIHCNSDWTKSKLQEHEYLGKLGDLYIYNPQSSYTTRVDYSHYQFSFPNDDVEFRVSGNYILRVIDEQTGAIIFDKRFIVFENAIEAEIEVKRATRLAMMDEYQEVDFTLRGNIFTDYDAYSEIRTVLLQNGRWDNAKIDIKPRYVKADEASYDHDMENTFIAGNEFHSLNIKTFEYKTEYVGDIRSMGSHFEIQIKPNKIRRFKVYLEEKDINGKSFVSFNAEEDGEIKADYMLVHFSLPYEAPEIEGEIYLLGEICNWEFSEKSKLEYNYETKAYEKAVWIKQGYFDYMYAMVYYNSDGEGNVRHIEGSHYETENDYQLIVYLRDRMMQYDRIIAYNKKNSALLRTSGY